MNKTTQDLVKNIEPTILNVDRRQKRMVTARLALIALATFIILLFTGIALDYLFAWRSPIMRWVFPLLALAGTIWLGAKVLLSLGRREQLDQSVRDIDSAYPALEERWSTVTNLSSSKDSAAVKGSPELLAQVATEASDFTEQVSAQKVVSPKSLARPSLAALLAAVALLAFCLGLSQFSGKLGMRFFNPWNPVTLTEIKDSTADAPVARGTDLAITASITGKVPKTARLVIRDEATGEKTTHPFELKESNDISFTAKKVNSDLSYQILSGDKVTPWRTVTVVAPPVIILTDFRLAPPTYTNKEAVTKDKLPFKIRSVEGSQLQLTFTSDQDLQDAYLLHESRSKKLTPIPLKKIADRTYQFEAQLSETFPFRPVIVNESGLENLLQPRCQITIFKDLPPTVKLLESSEDTALGLEDTLEVEFAAKDDYGIAQAELIVRTQNPGEEPKITTLPIDLADDQGKQKVRRVIDLPLEDLDLTEESQISYSIKVHDSRGLIEDGKKGKQLASEQSKPSDPSLAQNQDNDPNSKAKSRVPPASQSHPTPPSPKTKTTTRTSGQKQSAGNSQSHPTPPSPKTKTTTRTLTSRAKSRTPQASLSSQSHPTPPSPKTKTTTRTLTSQAKSRIPQASPNSQSHPTLPSQNQNNNPNSNQPGPEAEFLRRVSTVKAIRPFPRQNQNNNPKL